MTGTSKAKTTKAVLFENAEGLQAWIPLSVASVKFIGSNYEVRVTAPDWFVNKISWKKPEPYVPKVDLQNN
jgi:hypothetical protein